MQKEEKVIKKYLMQLISINNIYISHYQKNIIISVIRKRKKNYLYKRYMRVIYFIIYFCFIYYFIFILLTFFLRQRSLYCISFIPSFMTLCICIVFETFLVGQKSQCLKSIQRKEEDCAATNNTQNSDRFLTEV